MKTAAVSEVSLYNTMSRSVEPLKPLQLPRVRLYTCGPTVYNQATIGNYRTYIFEDVLVKSLRFLGYEVERVMNVTDVGHLTSDEDEGEDKLEVGARREGTTAWEVARKYEQLFLDEMRELNLEVPERLIKATDTIPQQIALIQSLEAKGYAYRLADGIYFDSSKVPDYGKLAHLDLEGLQAGARVAVQEGKRHPSDFALWKFSPAGKKRDMEWESPWGIGFPGWHIECSAIIADQLGSEIDIHCGGVDHIPVHHTNEIAQSESVTGRPLAHYWCHADFLLVDGGRMGKSLGNGYTLTDLKEHGFDPLAFRFFCYSASYRAKLNFTWVALQGAQTALDRLRNLASALGNSQTELGTEPWLATFQQALANDLNMPTVVAELWEMLRSDLSNAQKRWLTGKLDQVLGLDLFREAHIIPKAVQLLIEERQEARLRRDFALADRLRQEIEQLGFPVSDEPLTGGKK